MTDFKRLLQKPYPRPPARPATATIIDTIPQREVGRGFQQRGADRDPANPPPPNGTPTDAPSTAVKVPRTRE